MTAPAPVPVAIPRSELDVVMPERAPGFPFLKEREWFRLGDVFGVVIFDDIDKDWSHVVIGFEDGAYRAVDLGINAATCEAARQALFAKMQTRAHGAN
jgi:hypothetical protein